METQEKYRLKEILKKSMIASGRKYMKKAERQVILDGYQAVKKLGIYNQPAYACGRKEPNPRRKE